MKKFYQLLLFTTFIFGLSNCNTTKQEVYQLQKEAPFKIEKATYQEWVAGVRGGGGGISISLTINNFDASKITMDSIYFRNYKEALSKSGVNYIANFKTAINKQDDIILHKNPQNEYGNQAPVLKNNTPFNLSKNEAVISFKEKNKIKFIKINLVQIASPLYQ